MKTSKVKKVIPLEHINDVGVGETLSVISAITSAKNGGNFGSSGEENNLSLMKSEEKIHFSPIKSEEI